MACGECAKKLARGVVGLTKAALNINVAPDDVIEQRRATCRACEFASPCTSNPLRFCTCTACGCVLKAKTKIASESCPKGKWLAVEK